MSLMMDFPSKHSDECGTPTPKKRRIFSSNKCERERDNSRSHQEDKRVGGGDEDSVGCICSNAGCRWRFRGRPPSPAAANSPMTRLEGEGGGHQRGGDNLPPHQFFERPLLSVKEYRDVLTGDVRFAVFQGDRRVSVAQIMFCLKRGEDDRAYGHVKSVRVDREFRGKGLGPLLFKEVFTTLGNLSVTEVRLEAEEDMDKYDRLVRYYQALGFQQLKGSKVHYVHHCDQVYRKIPMFRQVSAPAQPRPTRRSPRLVDNGGLFLVVRLQTRAGSFVRSTANGSVVSFRALAGRERAQPRSCYAAPAAAGGADSGGGGGDGVIGGGCAVGVSEGCCDDGGKITAGGGAAADVGCGAGAGGGAAAGRGQRDAEGGRGSGGEGRAGREDESQSSRRGRRGGGGGNAGALDDLWTLTVDEARGVVCFESAYGKFLCVHPDGKVVADRSWDSSWEQFRLEKFAGGLPSYPPGGGGGDGGGDGGASGDCGRRDTVGEAGEGAGPSTTERGQQEDQRGRRHTPQIALASASPPAPSSSGGGGSGGGCSGCNNVGCGGLGGGNGGIGGGSGSCCVPHGEGGGCRAGPGLCDLEDSSGERTRPPFATAWPPSGTPSEISSGACNGASSARSASGGGCGDRVSLTRDCFALRTFHGQYLSLDAECGTVSASAQPVLWTTDEKNAICHCEGAVPFAAPPPASRRQLALQAHLRSMRQVQSVDFVSSVRQKYLGSFGRRGRFSVKDALDLLDRHHDPLQSARVSRVSFAGLMVLTAEDIREEGLPNWMQAIGLVHGLGRILHFLGENSGVTPIERECALGEYSWVVGAPFPDSIACPSYNADNADARDERYGGGGGNRPTGMYARGSGLDNALLCFTGPEYMHMVLRNHGASKIPPQGLAMLRLYPAEPWHAGDAYSELETPADKDLKKAVRQFDAIRRATLDSLAVQRREVNIERAWHHHLRDLVEEFFPGDLSW